MDVQPCVMCTKVAGQLSIPVSLLNKWWQTKKTLNQKKIAEYEKIESVLLEWWAFYVKYTISHPCVETEVTHKIDTLVSVILEGSLNCWVDKSNKKTYIVIAPQDIFL